MLEFLLALQECKQLHKFHLGCQLRICIRSVYVISTLGRLDRELILRKSVNSEVCLIKDLLCSLPVGDVAHMYIITAILVSAS